MQELGGILRQKRESMGFSLDEIEEKTKIRKRYIEALENGEWSVLPGRVYARGFVRSYAEVLGLDGQDLLQTYVNGQDFEAEPHSPASTPLRDDATIRVKRVDDVQKIDSVPPEPPRKAVAKMAEPRSLNEIQKIRSASPPPVPPAPPAPPKPSRKEPREEKGARRPGAAVGQTAIIVAALVVLGGGYYALRGHHAKGGTPPVAPTNSTLSGNTSPTKVANGTNSTGGIVNATNGTTGNGSTTNLTTTNTTSNATGVLANGTGNTTVGASGTGAVITSQPFQNLTQTYIVHTTSNLQVQLQVQTGSLWISVQADGKTVDGNDIVNAGQSRNFTGNNSVSLRVGHVQGVQLLINGQSVQLPNTQYAINIIVQRQTS